MGNLRYQVTLSTGPSVLQAPGDGFLWVVPTSWVDMDTSSLLIAFGPPLTFKAPALKLVVSNACNRLFGIFLNTTRIKYLRYSKDVKYL